MMQLSLLLQVCTHCILRLFSLHEQACSRPSVETPILSSILRELAEHEGDGAYNSIRETEGLTGVEYVNEYQEVCRVCRGILQFMYNDHKGMLVKENHACGFAAEIGDAVKKEGHQFDGFSLEFSLPPAVVENEQAVRLVIQINEFSNVMLCDDGKGNMWSYSVFTVAVSLPL